ncbi:hypothetical protein JCGZ_10371 [Jatropha curcas]|uniref:Uncharacterized protein n=1 Tax=Jatropha curcas TaxID=180498 RepID=A0A067KGZ3_JATCU|nr:CAX-interacting protein 4 [Jatropha curcas]KDP35387.1 hypothetical protein JCGZ_10371 [Jatropha curcas]
MSATAGRVLMPANNGVRSSADLQTHCIWQNVIGYEPYAPVKDDSKSSSQHGSSNVEPTSVNACANFQGLLALAHITNSNPDEACGACRKGNCVGYLGLQCRNFLSVGDPEVVQAAVLSVWEKIKENGKIMVIRNDATEEVEDKIDTTDFEVDSDIEGILARRSGKKSSLKARSSRKDKNSNEVLLDSNSGERKKRGRSKKRRSEKRRTNDSEDEGERKRRETRGKRDESSEEKSEQQQHTRKSRKEKRGRRSHRYSNESDSDGSDDSGLRHSQRSRKPTLTSNSNVCVSNEPRVGRAAKRSEKRSKNHHEEIE